MRTIFLESDPITAFPLTLETIKTQNRITHGQFDQLIPEVHLPAAYAWAEGYMKRAIVSRTHRWAIDDFPRTTYGRFVLPLGKTQSITSIQYVSGGSTTTLTGPSSGSPAGTDYQEDLRGDKGGVVMPAVGADWPDTDSDVPAPVLITFVAGLLPDTQEPDINQAILRYIGEALDEDEADSHKEFFLNPHRILRWT